jgi:hypothetical protein
VLAHAIRKGLATIKDLVRVLAVSMTKAAAVNWFLVLSRRKLFHLRLLLGDSFHSE